MGAIPMLFYGLITFTVHLIELAWILVGRPDVLGFARWAGGTRVDERSMSKRRGRAVSQGGTAGSARKEPTARTG